MKYNLSGIMHSAHTHRRAGLNMSQSLKRAWAEAKTQILEGQLIEMRIMDETTTPEYYSTLRQMEEIRQSIPLTPDEQEEVERRGEAARKAQDEWDRKEAARVEAWADRMFGRKEAVA